VHGASVEHEFESLQQPEARHFGTAAQRTALTATAAELGRRSWITGLAPKASCLLVLHRNVPCLRPRVNDPRGHVAGNGSDLQRPGGARPRPGAYGAPDDHVASVAKVASQPRHSGVKTGRGYSPVVRMLGRPFDLSPAPPIRRYA
jgi:hypothetical protein